MSIHACVLELSFTQPQETRRPRTLNPKPLDPIEPCFYTTALLALSGTLIGFGLCDRGVVAISRFCADMSLSKCVHKLAMAAASWPRLGVPFLSARTEALSCRPKSWSLSASRSICNGFVSTIFLAPTLRFASLLLC